MKISKIYTLSFAISANTEKSLLQTLSKKKNAKIVKGYMPLGKFKISRAEEIKKGTIIKKISYDTRTNHFFVDLAHGDLYYMNRMGAFKKNPEVVKSDFLRKIIDFPPEAISLLGQLHEFGSIPYDELNQTLVYDLAREGFIDIWEPEADQIFNLIRSTIEPDEVIMHKHFVKLRDYLPNFSNSRYNLDVFLHVSETVDDTYTKDTIRYSNERVCELLEGIFGGHCVLTGLVYLPYITCIHIEKDRHVSEVFFPLCARDASDVKTGFKDEVKLKPITFMTRMDAAGSVPLESSTISFSDVADLEDVKEKIRRLIVYPLVKPEVAKKFKKVGGGSVLFYGPPGCGKTYIARATVGECGLSFFNINTSDIIAEGSEVATKNLHDVFMRASKNAPTILFFDEIDAIGGARSDKGSQRVVVNQFLMEMDGIETLSENVLVIGSTNAPWYLDPALRRAGRFNDLIFIPPPDLKTRVEIFKIHTRKKPISEDIDFEKLAELTEGYASSDIKAICDDAIEIPWEEALHGIPERKANMQDFRSVIKKRKSSLTPWYKLAEREIKKSGESELFSELATHILKHAGGVDAAVKPGVTFADVGNMEDVKEEIRKKVVYPIKDPKLAESYGTKVGGGILFYGPPGCGKTYIARAAAGECEAAFFNIRITDILGEEEGLREKKLNYVFDRASRNTPAILFFDELDAIGGRRETTRGDARTLINQFLTEMDGFEKKEGVVVVGSTNAPWDIDPALRRAGRFTEQVYVPPPNKEMRIEIFKIHVKNKPVAKNINFGKLAELTEGYSSADIKAICDLAAEIPWVEALDGKEKREINMQDFLSVIKKRNSSIIPWFKLAKKQLKESGERDIYEELWLDIKTLSKKFEEKEKAEDKKKSKDKLKTEREKLEKMIKTAKQKFGRGEIDKSVYNEIMKDYEKRLIEIECSE